MWIISTGTVKMVCFLCESCLFNSVKICSFWQCWYQHAVRIFCISNTLDVCQFQIVWSALIKGQQHEIFSIKIVSFFSLIGLSSYLYVYMCLFSRSFNSVDIYFKNYVPTDCVSRTYILLNFYFICRCILENFFAVLTH